MEPKDIITPTRDDLIAALSEEMPYLKPETCERIGGGMFDRMFLGQRDTIRLEGILAKQITLTRDILNDGCKLYCCWYDTGQPEHMDGSAMAYQLVSVMRRAIERIDKAK